METISKMQNNYTLFDKRNYKENPMIWKYRVDKIQDANLSDKIIEIKRKLEKLKTEIEKLRKKQYEFYELGEEGNALKIKLEIEEKEEELIILKKELKMINILTPFPSSSPGVFDPIGVYPNPIDNTQYSNAYRKYAKNWTSLPIYEHSKRLLI